MSEEKVEKVKIKVPNSRGVVKTKGKTKDELKNQYSKEENAFFKASEEEQKEAVKKALKERDADASDKKVEEELARIKSKRRATAKAVRDLGNDYNDNFFLIASLEDLASYNKKNPYNKYFTSIRSKGNLTPLNLFAKFSGQEAFHQLTPDQLSLLTPYVKFSVVRYGRGNSQEILYKNETEVPLQGGYLDPDSSILDPFARGQVGRGNIGLTSFSWTLIGKDPATAGTLQAKLELFCDSLLVLDKKPYSTMLARTQTGIEVKAVVGWSASPQTREFLGAKLYNAIKQARQTILMTQNQFEFDFKQDGSFNLTIDYTGRYDIWAKKFDLLKIPRSQVVKRQTAHKVKDKLKQKETEKLNKKPAKDESVFGEVESTAEGDRPYEDANPVESDLFKSDMERESEQEANEIINEAADGLNDEDFKTAASDERTRQGLKKSLRDGNAAAKFESLVVDQIDKEASQRKQENMSNFQRKLYGDFAKSNKIRVLKVDKDAYDSYKKSIVARRTAKDRNKEIDDENAKKDTVGEGKSKSVEGTKIKSDQEKLVGESEKKGKVGPKKKIKRVKEPDVVAKPTGVHIGKAEILDKVKYDTQAAADSHYISFFFLGDLFDVIHEIVKDNGSLGEMPHVFLASFRFYNHFTKTEHMIEMADIPIALGRYNAWFHRHYVAKKVNTIGLAGFINNIFKNLVRPVFTGEAFYDAPPKGNPAVCQIKSADMSGAKYSKKIFGRQNASSLVKNNEGLFHYPGKGNSKNYLIVTSDLARTVHSGGDRAKDARMGIMHYYMGRDAGIIENVNFQIEPIQGLRESAITRANAGSAVDIARFPYRANLKCTGNPLFHLGSKFYLLPTLPGGNARYVAGRLGLGGYYVVIGISNTISPGRYETIVNAKQESMATYNKNDTISNESEDNSVKKVGGPIK